MMKKLPLISIIIPTYNSDETLTKVLESIQKQTYPSRLVEVLVIDGGSTDETLRIAKKYKAKVLFNRKQHQVYAKFIGQMKAKGKYIMHLDSDEVIENKKSIEIKINAFLKHDDVKAIVPSGHKTPSGVSAVNRIINDFGDPFSFYMYGFSFNSQFFINQLKSKFKVLFENKDVVIIDFQKSKQIPGIEMSATGMVLDREYLLNTFPQVKKYPRLISQTFFLYVERGTYVGFTKNDPIIHYSASSWIKYLKKIRSRILNNVYMTEMGKSAFSGRTQFYSNSFAIKKLLFIPYSVTFLLPLTVGITLSITRKSIVFLSYPFLCLYISYLVMYYSFLKAIGRTPQIKGYGI